METVQLGQMLSTTAPQNVETPGCDGNMSDNEILKTGRLAEDVAEAPKHSAVLLDKNFNLQADGPAIRLLNDDDGCARWITFAAFSHARPQPEVRPADQDSLEDLMAGTVLARERRGVTALHEKWKAEYKQGNFHLSRAYGAASKLRYWATVGTVAWRHLSEDFRENHLENFPMATSDPNCCQEAHQIIHEALPDLSDCTSLSTNQLNLD